VKAQEIVAVILAGGFGKRIQHLLPNLPKPMAPVAGKPCLEWIVRYLVKQGVHRIILSTGYLSETIEHHFASQPVAGARVRCVPEIEPLGTGGGVLHAIQASAETAAGWLVLNGDTIAFADLSRARAALEDRETAGAIYARAVPDTSRYGSLVTDANGRLVRFEEKKPGKGIISTGVYLLRDSVLGLFPEQKPLSLEQEVFPALTGSGVSLKVLEMNAPFLDIGTPESLPEGDAFVRANLHWFELGEV
jgi:NDP-sugar pyrophosphorylase family protein